MVVIVKLFLQLALLYIHQEGSGRFIHQETSETLHYPSCFATLWYVVSLHRVSFYSSLLIRLCWKESLGIAQELLAVHVENDSL